MSPPDYSNGPANTDSFITHCLTLCFILLCVIPLFLCFKRETWQTFAYIGNITKHTYFSIARLFKTLYGWYTLWMELRQLQPCEQQQKQLNTDDLLAQTPPPQEEYITKVREQWIQTPIAEQVTSFQDLQQDFQVSNAEFSLDLHVPNISLERIHTPLVVHNDQAFTEFIKGEERCLKFINQDLQASHIPSTFTNVSHTPTPLKESSCITLPTRISKENNNTACTQTVQPALGFTPAEIRRAQNEPTLMIPQLLKIEPCKDYTDTPLQTLDGLYVTQLKRF